MKKLKRNSVLLASVLVLALGVVGCAGTSREATGGKIEEIKAADKVIIGVFGDKPPFGYVASDGTNKGYDIYLAHQIAEDLLGDSSKVEFVTIEAANRVEYLKSKKVDIVLANFTVTEERKEQVDFAEAYMKVALGIVAADGTEIKSIEDLDGKTLIVNKGTTAELYFTEKYPNVKLISYEENTETFQALKDGRGDALAHDNTLLFAWVFENEGFTIVDGNVGSQDTIAPAVNKVDSDLLDWLNNEIKTLTADGFFEKAYDAELKDHFSADTKKEDVIYTK